MSTPRRSSKKPKPAKKGPKTVKVDLSLESLDTLVLVVLLHQNARMDTMAKVPAPSSGEITAFARQQDRLMKLREHLEAARVHLED